MTWLATFYAEGAGATGGSAFQSISDAARIPDGKIGIVVEVTRKQEGEWLVVFATLRPAIDDGSSELTGILAFSNSSSRCDRCVRDGLPAFEAEIEHDRDELSISIQAFGVEASPGVARTQSTRETFFIKGLPITAEPDLADNQSPAIDVTLHFAQTVVSPSPVDPGGQLQVTRSGRRVRGRFQSPAVQREVFIEFPALRYPNLSPLDAVSHNQPATHVWHGSWTDTKSRAPAPSNGAKAPEHARTSSPYVPASFRFEEVEWLGFRINLRDTGVAQGEIDELLKEMLEALNRQTGGSAAGQPLFEAASSTINIDLLRYGRMKLGRPWGRLSADNYFSQHELVLRVAVRRVDDLFDGATAVHVPAIFVDNPWSRYLGRETLGFDKRMVAVYDAERQLLRDDGRQATVTAASAGALTSVRHVVLRDRPPPPKPDDQLQLLGLDYSIDPERASFIDVADDRLLAPSAVTSFGWRANEIAGRDDEAFATDVRVQRLSGFRGVQAAPVDTRPLEPAIVESRVVFQRVRLAFPDGLATLRLGAPDDAPAAWRRLQEFLAGHGGSEITLPAGDWYRMQCDMRLEVIDPLGW